MDNSKIEAGVRLILEGIGENPEREGLIETPRRVAKMCNEVLEGTKYSNEDIARMYGKTFTAEQSDGASAVVMKDITVFSYCEHHLALMYDMSVNVAYIPNGRVIGLSKIARICEMAAKRLQLQERLTNDIAQIISIATGAKDIAVRVEGHHSCMTARGIKNTTSKTVTTTYLGKYELDKELQRQLE